MVEDGPGLARYQAIQGGGIDGALGGGVEGAAGGHLDDVIVAVAVGVVALAVELPVFGGGELRRMEAMGGGEGDTAGSRGTWLLSGILAGIIHVQVGGFVDPHGKRWAAPEERSGARRRQMSRRYFRWWALAIEGRHFVIEEAVIIGVHDVAVENFLQFL